MGLQITYEINIMQAVVRDFRLNPNGGSMGKSLKSKVNHGGRKGEAR